MADFHALVWAKDKPGDHQAKAGDIIDIMPADTKWSDKNMETKLCVIVPLTGLTKEEAMALKQPGDGIKRKFKIQLDEIPEIDTKKAEDEKLSYQPLISLDAKIDVIKTPIVKDKTDALIDLKSIDAKAIK